MNAEQTKDFLALDVTSLATASAHDAAARVAGVAFSPSVLNWNQNCWFNAGAGMEIDAAEAAVQQLGAYVASRREQPGGEQLFNKATELGLHSLASWHIQPVWLKACYRVFAITAFTLGSELRNAQERMRDEEELRRRASLAAEPAAPPKAEDTVMEQHADVHERVDLGSAMGTAAVGEAEPAPAQNPEQETEQELSAGDASPVAADDAPVEDGAASSSTLGSTSGSTSAPTSTRKNKR